MKKGLIYNMVHTSFCFELEAHLVHDNQHCYTTNEVRLCVSLYNVIKLGLASQKLVFRDHWFLTYFRLQPTTTNWCKFDVFRICAYCCTSQFLVVKGGWNLVCTKIEAMETKLANHWRKCFVNFSCELITDIIFISMHITHMFPC